MGTGIRTLLTRAAPALLLALLLPAGAWGRGKPSVLIVPLIAGAGSESWASPLVEDILREKMSLVGGWSIVAGEAGEEVLRFASMVLGRAVDSAGTPNDFIGHIGGDDFIIITHKDALASIVGDLQQRFSAEVGAHYDWATRQQGYLTVQDEAGNETTENLMDFSIGVVTAEDGPFADIREITEVAASARR